jgi:hypothetical protein
MATRNTSGGPPVSDGAIVGGSVWLVGFVLSFIVGIVLIPLFGGNLFWTLVLYLSANVGGLITGGGLGQGYMIVLFLIPVFGALAGGYVVGSGRRTDAMEAGATVGVGFFVLQLLGLVAAIALVSSSLGGSFNPASIGLDTILILVVGGLVQPAVLGAVGGALSET